MDGEAFEFPRLGGNRFDMDNFIASLKPLGLHHIAERLGGRRFGRTSRALKGYLAFREAYLRLTDATPPQLKFRIALAAQELSGMGQNIVGYHRCAHSSELRHAAARG